LNFNEENVPAKGKAPRPQARLHEAHELDQRQSSFVSEARKRSKENSDLARKQQQNFKC